jgi:formate--tetrahydrofolate ligase
MLPIRLARRRRGFSDNAGFLGVPQDFVGSVCSFRVCAGAGFLVAFTGNIMTMPGLPKVPSAEKIDVDETGRISGLF